MRDEPLDVCTWVHSLHERLELVRDVVRQRLEKEHRYRKSYYDRSKSSGSFNLMTVYGLGFQGWILNSRRLGPAPGR